jgi:hypothetical protein
MWIYRLLAPEEHGATVSNFIEALLPTTGAGQRRHAGRGRAVRLELPARGNHSRCGHAESDRGVSPTGACLLGSAHAW